jgi:hypothetical protein
MSHDPLDKHKSIDLKLFEPITICRHVALRNREEGWPTPDLADLGRGRWYELPDGHGLFRGGGDDHPIPGPAEVITAGPLHAALA